MSSLLDFKVCFSFILDQDKFIGYLKSSVMLYKQF